MKRGIAIAFVVVAAGASAFALLHSQPANAELENSIFTSKADRLRLVVPRGWRATDEPSYPGLLLWMMRSEPEGRIVLTSEPFTRDVYCSWPVRCQMSHDALPAKVACALGSKLSVQRIRVGPVQAGPKENEEAGLPSVWFEYDDGHQFLRQAVAIDQDRVVSLVLSAPSAEARNAHVRAFEQALRTLRPLNAQEMGAPAGSASGSSTGSASASASSTAAAPASSTAATSASPTAAATGSAAGSSTGSATGSSTRSATASSSGSGATTGAATTGGATTGAATTSAATTGGATTGGATTRSGAAAGSGTALPYQSAPPPPLSPIGPCTNR